MCSVNPLGVSAAAAAGAIPVPLPIFAFGIALSSSELAFCQTIIQRALDAPSSKNLEMEERTLLISENTINADFGKAIAPFQEDLTRIQNEMQYKEASLIPFKAALELAKNKIQDQEELIKGKYKELRVAILHSIRDHLPLDEKQKIDKVRDDLLNVVKLETQEKEALETAYNEQEKNYNASQAAARAAILDNQRSIEAIQEQITVLKNRTNAALAENHAKKVAFFAKNSEQIIRLRSLKAVLELFNPNNTTPVNKDPRQLKIVVEVFERAKIFFQLTRDKLQVQFERDERIVREKISLGDTSTHTIERDALNVCRDQLVAKTNEHDAAIRQLTEINRDLKAQLATIFHVSNEWKKVISRAKEQDSERFEETTKKIIELGKKQFEFSQTISRCKTEKEEAERAFVAQKNKYADSVIHVGKQGMQNRKRNIETNLQVLNKCLQALQSIIGENAQLNQYGPQVGKSSKPLYETIKLPLASRLVLDPPTSQKPNKKRKSPEVNSDSSHDAPAAASASASKNPPAAVSTSEAARLSGVPKTPVVFVDETDSVQSKTKRVRRVGFRSKISSIMSRREFFNKLHYKKTSFPKGSFLEYLVNLSYDHFTLENIEKFLEKKKKEELAEIFKLRGNRTPLHIIAEIGSPEILSAFVNKYSDHLDFSPTKEGQNVFTFIAHNGTMNTNAIEPVIKLLMAKRINTLPGSQLIMPPLHIASYLGHLEIVKAFVNLDKSIVRMLRLSLDPIRSSVLGCRVDVFKWYACNVIKTKKDMVVYAQTKISLNNLAEEGTDIEKIVTNLSNLRENILPDDPVFLV